jgi:crotonobetainyl-CoA:carnitine CoA-transferase CaiB-like acyl-CoA transferase
MALPLSGLEVVDLGTPTPGKYATFLLAEMGAAVLRVERPSAAGGGVSDEDRVLNRGKRSLTLDLRHQAGRQVLHRLAQRADVLIESNRPGVAERLGADWRKLSEINPRLVYCSLSGFGQSGPDRSLPAYDLNFAGVSGLLSALFGAGVPPRVPETYLADGISGLTSTLAIAFALLERERARRGRRVDVAMLDSVFSFLAVSHGLGPARAASPGPPKRATESPLYSIYETADGRYLTLAAVRPSSLDALCREIGRPDLVERAAAGEPDGELSVALRAAFKTAAAGEWIARLRRQDVEVGPVNLPEEAFAEAQLRARGLVEEGAAEGGGARQLVTTAFRPTWGEAGAARAAAPLPGESSDQVLAELGYQPAEIAQLRRSGTI